MKKIDVIIEFFTNLQEYPNEIRLNQCEVITDVRLFVKTHIDICKAKSGKIRYKPYFDRLEKVYNKLNEKKRKSR